MLFSVVFVQVVVAGEITRKKNDPEKAKFFVGGIKQEQSAANIKTYFGKV